MEMFVNVQDNTSDGENLFQNGDLSAVLGLWGIRCEADGTFRYQVVSGGVYKVGTKSVTTLPGKGFLHLVVLLRAGTWEYYINGAVDTANAGTDIPDTPAGGATQVRVNDSGGPLIA